MRGYNQVILVGNCGKDPEVKKLADGTLVAKINLATTLSYRNSKGEVQSTTDWHPVILWRGLAELAEKHVHKGSLLMIKGKLKPRNFENKEGITIYVTEVVADEMLLLDKKPGTQNDYPTEDQTPPF